MSKFIKKFVKNTKGMEALQAVALVAVGILLALALQSTGNSGTASIDGGMGKIIGGGK